ncbi:hypothetical protein BC937DRAFT_94598 [Endogone sp. FLAS-F59071]|nr:hypothetical protein BC937DRAFT_94598 [Endogone sp. FLAS-F59071]|eukprot:RUS13923.1 hypothetical protein BC937DRAFT_94598 [Endogone sp. FLAS-F59071]
MNPFLAEDTVLGAVRLLATCGQRMMVDSGLKESEFKDTEVENKDETTSSSIAVNIVPSTPTSTSWRMSQSLEEEQFFFRWFPVVSALSRIVIESESPRVRSHALDTLFDILRSTGGIFETAHWRKLYRSVLAPLFEDLRSPESRRKHDMIGIWVQTLRQMIVLYDMFYEAFASNPEFLDQIMDLIGLMTESKALPTPASGSTTTEPSLGQMSVGCLYQLVSQCSTRFDEAAWEAVTRGIEKLFTGTTPIELLEVGEYERRESWKRPLEEDDSPRSDDLGGLHEAKTSMPINGWPRSRPTSMSTPEQSGQRSPRQSSPPALNGKNSNGFYLDFAAAVVKCGIHLAAIQCVRDLTIEDTSYLPMPTIRQSSSTNDRPLSPLPPAYSLARLPAHLRERWTCCLYNSYIFARQFNGNYPLRAYLFRSGYVQQMPNLIKQETLALTVYIAMLFDVYRAIGDGGDPESPAADVVSEAKQMITRFTDLIDAEPAKNQRDVTKNLRDMANWACLPVVVYREISKTPWWQETIGWRKEQQEEEKGESVRYITLKQEMMWFFKTAVKMVGVSNVEVRRSVQDFLEGMSEYLEIV